MKTICKIIFYFVLVALLHTRLDAYDLELNLENKPGNDMQLEQKNIKYTIWHNPGTEFIVINGVSFASWAVYAIYDLINTFDEDDNYPKKDSIKECSWLWSDWNFDDENLRKKETECRNMFDNHERRGEFIKYFFVSLILNSLPAGIAGALFIPDNNIDENYGIYIFGGALAGGLLIAVPGVILLTLFPKKNYEKIITHKNVASYYIMTGSITTLIGYYLFKHFYLGSVFARQTPADTDSSKLKDKLSLNFNILPNDSGLDLSLTFKW